MNLLNSGREWGNLLKNLGDLLEGSGNSLSKLPHCLFRSSLKKTISEEPVWMKTGLKAQSEKPLVGTWLAMSARNFARQEQNTPCDVSRRTWQAMSLQGAFQTAS